MRRFTLFCLSGILLLLSIPALAQDTEPTLAPVMGLENFQAVNLPETPPEINLTDSINLTFNYNLDCDTVDDAVVLVPSVRGDWQCDENSLTFTPQPGYEQQTAYTLRISDALKTDDMREGRRVALSLARTLVYRFSTPGFLRVTDVLPAPGSNDISAGTDITVIFNRPIVPLVIVEEMGDLPDPLQFDPVVSGEGEWLNTFIYTFTPDEALLPGTTYNITIDESLTSADGAQMAADYAWRFTTDAPQIVRVFPRDGRSGIAIDQEIYVSFNLPVDQYLLEDNFYLRPVDFPDDYSEPGTWEWDEDGLNATFTPDNLLSLETVYEAGIDEDGIRTGIDQVAFEGASTWTFTTLPYPEWLGTAPDDGGVTGSYSGFGIDFNTFMDADSITERLTIEPEPPEGSFRGYRSRFSYVGSFPASASTTYTVTVEPGYQDIYGNVLNQRIEFTYSTDRHYPAMNLAIPAGSIGFYNAYFDQTALYIQHRNIDSVNLSLFQIPTGEFVDLLKSGTGYRSRLYDYYPPEEYLMRAGEVRLDAPENVYVPSLIVPGNDNVICEGALDTRLRVGMSAQVISDSPLPLERGNLSPDVYAADIAAEQENIESLEGDPFAQATATIRATHQAPGGTPTPPPPAYIYEGFTMAILGEPVCHQNTLWYRVRLEDNVSGWIPESQDGEYVLEPVQMDRTRVAVNDSTDALDPGVYYLSVGTPDTSPRNHYMMVMTASLMLKTSFDEVMVWATDAATGDPIPEAPISIYDNTGIIAGGLTDSEGLLHVTIPNLESLRSQGVFAVLDSDDHLGVGASYWSDGIDPGRFSLATNYETEDYTIYLYTDRSAFRPGETVYYRGMVRRKDDMSYFLPDLDTVNVVFNNGEDVITEEMDLSPSGTFSGSFDLAETAPLGGYYNVRAVIQPVPGGDTVSRTVNFSVAEFRLPEFEVNVTPEIPEVVRGDTIRVAVEGRYFFGGNLTNATVFYRVVTEDYSFNYDGPDRYSFFSSDPYDYRRDDVDGYGRRIAEGVGNTGENGIYILEIPAEPDIADSSVAYNIEVTLNDETGRGVNSRARVVIHNGEMYIGSRPEQYIGTAGMESTLNLIAVNLESEPLVDQELQVEAVRVKWNSVQERDDLGRTAWTWEEELFPVSDGTVTTDANGRAQFSFTPDEGGSYRVITTGTDARGNTVRNVARLWVRGTEYVSWRQGNNNRIDLVTDSDSYSVGDTAEILIASPFQGEAQALITVERMGVITTDVVTLNNNSYVYELPILPDYAPNVFVGVMVVKGVDEFNPVTDFRMGMTEIKVNTERKVITLDVESSTERAGPQETVSYTIRATDYRGDPVDAEIGVGLTDKAALQIGFQNSEPLLDYFYSDAGLSVRTSTPLTINTDIITQNIIDTMKGGGGGGGQALPFAFDVRGDFINTPFWDGTLVTDENGEVSFDVTLPDNLTTWTLDARAISRAEDGVMLVGQTTYDIISTRPLLIRPVAPRFFVVGDQLNLGAVINNGTDEDLEIWVKLESTGLRLTVPDSQTQTVTVPADGRVRVDWEVTVLDTDGVELVFATQSLDERFNDAARPALGEGDNNILPVYNYEAPETVATGGVIREGGVRTETIILPQTMQAGDAELTVRVEPSLAAGLQDSLRYLYTYDSRSIPYTVSRFLPNLMTYRALQSLDIENPFMEDMLDDSANLTLQKLYNEQKSDGGWGWYLSENSDATTTAYALIALSEARSQGYPVPGGVIDLAQDFLREQFIVPGLSQSTYRLNRQAFLLYALARSGAPDMARAANLYEYYEVLNLDAQVFLAMTLHLADPDSTTRLDAIMANLVSQAIISATGTHWEEGYRDRWNWSTDTRTTALVLHALIHLDPESELIPQTVRWLMVAREGRSYWYTTQETAWSIMALTDWMLLSGELQPDYSYIVTWNDDELLLEDVTPAQIDDTETLIIEMAEMLLDEEGNQLSFDRTDGDGVLYYTARLRVQLPVSEVQALDRGIIVRRQYFLEDDLEDGDDTETPITEARVGDNVRVRLTIIAPESLHYVTIEDPLPAGAEAIDPQLPTSQQEGTQAVFSRSRWTGWGWWYLKQREFKDEMVRLHASYLPAGTYEFVYSIRPGLVGTYNVMPPVAEETYFPEVFGRGDGMTFTILPAETETTETDE